MGVQDEYPRQGVRAGGARRSQERSRVKVSIGIGKKYVHHKPERNSYRTSHEGVSQVEYGSKVPL